MRSYGRFVISGAAAGVCAALVFTVVHQIMISAIWFAAAAMLTVGALAGACLAWSYRLVAPAPSARGWVRYNLCYLVMFLALGVTSMIVFEPVATIGALLAAKKPPVALIGRALPVTELFTLATAGVLAVLYRASWPGAIALLLTSSVLVMSLGLNISILGLVAVNRNATGVLIEVAALLTTIMGSFAWTVWLLQRQAFSSRGSSSLSTGRPPARASSGAAGARG